MTSSQALLCPEVICSDHLPPRLSLVEVAFVSHQTEAPCVGYLLPYLMDRTGMGSEATVLSLSLLGTPESCTLVLSLGRGFSLKK